jgi:hypothetical protein
MKRQKSGISAEGRTEPPQENRFRKGRSGNPAGRPKGSISRTNLTRKVAQKKHTISVDGKARRISTLDLLIRKTQAMAASGHVAAARLINWLRSEAEQPGTDAAEGGFLLVPGAVTPEEFLAQEEARNAGKLEPGTEVNIKTEEFLKAIRGEASPLGEALQAFYEKYGKSPSRSQANL